MRGHGSLGVAQPMSGKAGIGAHSPACSSAPPTWSVELVAVLAGVLSFGGPGQLVPGHWLGAVCGQCGMSVSSFYVLSFPGRGLGFWMQLDQRKILVDHSW